MKLSLNDREWREFKVGVLFEIEKCRCNNVSILSDGDIPYVGATNRNNGTMSFVENKEKLLTKGNCIVFICDGQGSGGYSIYKKEDFIGSTTLKIGRNKNLNKYTGMFLTSALDKNRSIYSYGYKRSENRLKSEKIQLPVTKDDETILDWQFMEDYVREIEEEKIKNYTDYVIEILKDIEFKEIEELKEKEWGEFYIYDVFNYQRGKRQIKDKRLQGKVPYYSASEMNNGLTDFILNPSFVIDTNAIIYTTFGDSYYVEKNFSTSDEITILTNAKLNKYIGLFICKSINQNKSKYSFGRKAFSNKISKDKILLPIDKNNKPDYAYMEQYVKNTIIVKYNKYLNFKGVSINKSISNT